MNSFNYQPIPEEGGNRPRIRNICSIVNASVLLLLFAGLAATIIDFMMRGSVQKVVVLTPITVYQTSQEYPDRLSEMNAETFLQRGFHIPETELGLGNTDCKASAGDLCASAARVTVNTERNLQMILGFGGAFTEASAVNFDLLPIHVQDRVIELYFGNSGIGYSMGRVHINSCDFALGSYNFDDVENDYLLEHFDYGVQHDTESLLPFILRAIKASSRPIKLLASPWSPPAWMKEAVAGEQKMTGSADPQGLRNDPRVKTAWADYITKFIDAYSWQGVPIWGITVQNEPKFAAPWEALKMTDDFQRDFVHEYLGPQMEKRHPRVKLLIFDHNKNNMTEWVRTVLQHKDNNKYVSGVAFHWYAGSNDREMDGTYGYDEVNSTYHLIPDKILLATEGCSCPGVLLNDWFRAERFAHDVIFDLRAHVQGWIDWNLLLDAEGGPNHVGNNCDAPILLTPDKQGIHVQPKYYFMGHFSKYVPPGARRVESAVVGNYKYAKIDPRVRAGFEVGLFACEKSSRQMWKFTEENLLALTTPSMQDGYPMELCLAGPIGDRPFVRIVYCMERSYSQPLRFTHISGDQIVETGSGLCLGLAGTAAEPGAMLELTECKSSNHRQSFSMDHVTGEVKSKVADLCVTAGWPFLSGVAFQDSDSTVTVIMNEAPLDTEILLHDVVRNKYALFGINSRSIQTIVYN